MSARIFWNLRIDKKFSPKVGLIHSMLEENRFKLKRMVKSLKPKHLAWQPDKDTNSVGTLLLHIAEAELFWMQEVIAGKPLTKKQKQEFRCDLYGGQNTSQIEKHPLKFFFAKLDKVRAYTGRVLGKLRDKDLDQVHRSEKERITNGWILYHLIEHEASHFGQIGSLKNKMKRKKLI